MAIATEVFQIIVGVVLLLGLAWLATILVPTFIAWLVNRGL